MKPYGMTRRDADTTSYIGITSNGRATAVYNLKPAAYRSLRNGKKAKIRRVANRTRNKMNSIIVIVGQECAIHVATELIKAKEPFSMTETFEFGCPKVYLNFKFACDNLNILQQLAQEAYSKFGLT